MKAIRVLEVGEEVTLAEDIHFTVYVDPREGVTMNFGPGAKGKIKSCGYNDTYAVAFDLVPGITMDVDNLSSGMFS